MRSYLLTAPQWVLSVVFGVFFGFGTALFGIVVQDGSSIIGRLVGSLIGRTLFGLVMGRYTFDLNQHARAAAGPLTDDQFRAAARAQRRGPVPSDPRVREATEQLIQFRLTEYEDNRQQNLLVLAVLTVGLALAAVFVSAWWGVGALACALGLIAQVVGAMLLARRLDTVQTAGPPPEAPHP